MRHVTGALRAQIGGSPDIANDAKGDPVTAMIPAPTAYEQMCPTGTYASSLSGDCICNTGTYRI